MTRRRDPLPERSDGEVLALAARHLNERARATGLALLRDLAHRLHGIRRRAPLWDR